MSPWMMTELVDLEHETDLRIPTYTDVCWSMLTCSYVSISPSCMMTELTHTYTVKEAQKIIKKEEEKKAEAAARLRNFTERGGRNTGPVSPVARTPSVDTLSPTTTISVTNYSNRWLTASYTSSCRIISTSCTSCFIHSHCHELHQQVQRLLHGC